MSKKTERLYGAATLVGDDLGTAGESFRKALANLGTNAENEKREVLYDTLDVSIERDTMDNVTLAGGRGTISTYTTITVSAEAVKR